MINITSKFGKIKNLKNNMLENIEEISKIDG